MHTASLTDRPIFDLGYVKTSHNAAAAVASVAPRPPPTKYDTPESSSAFVESRIFLIADRSNGQLLVATHFPAPATN